MSKSAAPCSTAPLAKKLGLKEGSRVLWINRPKELPALLEPLPNDVVFEKTAGPRVDITHFFVTQKADLVQSLTTLRKKLKPDAALWVSWPKKAAKVATDITEDTIRAVVLPLGFVDIKVCAVTEIWSGLKLVVRRELR